VRPAQGDSLIGRKIPRERTLTDPEIYAFLAVYPAHALSGWSDLSAIDADGLRLNEVAKATRSEFDRREGMWVIPASRMKGRHGEAKPHAVPLTPDILAVFDCVATVQDRAISVLRKIRRQAVRAATV